MLQSPARKIEALVARDPNLKLDAQRAFVAYIKGVFLMKNKNIFNVEALNLEKYAYSLGLAVMPRVRFLKGKISSETLHNKKIQEHDDSSDALAKKMDKLDYESGSESEVTEQQSEPDRGNERSSDDENENFLTIKRRNHEIDIEPVDEVNETAGKKSKLLTKAAIAKKMLKKNILPNRKTLFDEEGENVDCSYRDKLSKEGKEYETENAGGIDIEKAKLVLKAEDKFDKKLFREKVKGKHKSRKMKLKQERKGEGQGEDEELKDDFGTDSESSGPDVSWIPDPDKFYGEKNSEMENSQSDNDNGEDVESDDDDNNENDVE